MNAMDPELIYSFEKNSSGWIFWNFDIESSSYQWSFLNLIEKDYIVPIESEKLNNFYNFYNCIIILFILISLILLIIILVNNKITVIPSYQNLLYSNIQYYEVVDENRDNQIEMNKSKKNYGSIRV